MRFLYSCKTKSKDADSPKKLLQECLSEKNSHKNASGDDNETAGTHKLPHSPESTSRNRQGSTNHRANIGDCASNLPLTGPPSPSTKSRLHCDSVSSSSSSSYQRQVSQREGASDVATPPLQRVSATFPGSPNPRASRNTDFPMCGATTGFSVRGLSATEPPAAPFSLPKEADKGMVMLPAVDLLHSLRTPSHYSDSCAPTSTDRKYSSPASRSATISSTPATSRSDVTSATQQPPVTRLSPADIRTVWRPAVHVLEPLPGDSGKTPPTGFPDRTAVPSPPDLSTASASKEQQSAWSKSHVAAPAVVPPPPPPLPTKGPSSPVFTAMESVPKRRSSSFRVLKSRKGACEGVSSASGESISTSTNSNGSSDTIAALIKGNAAAGVSDSSNSVNGVTFDSFRKEHRVNCERTGMGAQPSRRELVTRFADTVDDSPRYPKRNPSVVVHIVPTPPPMNVGKLDSFRCTVSTLQSNTGRTNSIYSNHSAQSTSDETVSLENPPSVRRSQRSSIRLTTPRSTVRAISNCSLSLDDVPRPLTRHASTLSTEQQEALRRTPSFLSRVHTPPPLGLRELVQMRKGRRVLQVRCNTPDAHAAAPVVLPESEQSLSSNSMVMLSGLLPSVSDDGKLAALSSARSSDHGSPVPGRDKNANVSRQPSKDLAATGSGATSSNGSSAPGSRNGRRAAEWWANGAKLPSEAGASSDAPKLPDGETIKSPPQPHCIPLPPPFRHSYTPEPQLPAVSPPPLSRSPDPLVTSASASKSEPKIAASVHPATTTSAAGNIKRAPVSPVSQDLHKKPSSNTSLLLDEVAAFDYYGLYMLSTPQFSIKPEHRTTDTTTPAGESASAASIDEVIRGQQQRSKQESKPQKLETACNSTADGAAVEAKKRNDVSITLSESVRLSVVDLLAAVSGEALTEATDARNGEGVTSPVTPNPNKSSPKDVPAVRRACRQRVVSAYADEDEDGFFQMARTTLTSANTSSKPQGNSYGRLSLGPAPRRVNGYDCFTSALSTAKSFSSSGEALPTLPVNTVAPSRVLVTTAVAAPSRAQLHLSSSSSLSSEEEYGNLLEGFRPAGFDAHRGARSSSTIVFYLNKEDSLSSLDVVVRAASNAHGSGATPSSLIDSKLSPQNEKLQSKCSTLRLSTIVTTGGGGARPHVTFDPYVEESTRLVAQLMPSAPSSILPDSHMTKSFISSSNLDPYGLTMDSSLPSLQLNANTRGSRTALGGHSVSGVQSKPSNISGPVSIFLGTTVRFAPDKSKMHRPLANTFGYTNAQRRARAAAMAAGVSAEEWARAAGIDEDTVDSEEGVYGEVYTDENGDEWYWEEVEDEEEVDEEGEEYEDKGDDEEENAGNTEGAPSTATR